MPHSPLDPLAFPRMDNAFRLTFADGHRAEAVRVHRSDNLSTTLQNWGFAVPQSALVLVGGASGISEEGMVMLRSLFTDALAPLVQRFNIPVIDGGTDAGIMKLIGQARHSHGSTFPLIGVAAIGTVILPGSPTPPPPDGAELEPNHTHFLLVPGALWGDEAPWIARTASALATGVPSVTILVNGGKIAWQDVLNSVRANRPVIVIAGSGRTADELTAAIRGEFISEMAEEMVDSGLLQAIDLADGLDTITQTLMRLLSVPQSRVS